MIFYFSGTGNSRAIAKDLSEKLGERAVFIPDALERGGTEIDLDGQERLGFVFPTYAWAPPQIVLKFISALKVSGGPSYIYGVCSCGDDCGRTVDVLRGALERKGLWLDGGFSVIMPNNYVVLFDVDDAALQKEKLQQAAHRMQEIGRAVDGRQPGFDRIHRGRFARIKTYFVHPLFNRWGARPQAFYATKKCTGCGLCVRVCPTHNIALDALPSWGKKCVGCLACLHHCPTRAIQHGKRTQAKGRYVYPMGRPMQDFGSSGSNRP